MRVAFAGGGIVGMTAAIALCERKFDVTVFEPEEPVVYTMAGSACKLATSEIFPLPNPSTLSSLPRLLVDRSGPLVLRPAHLPHMIRWGLHFLAASRPSNVERSTEIISALNRDSTASTVALARRAGAERFLECNGGIQVAYEQRTVEKLRKDITAFARAEIPAEFLDGAKVRELEPTLAPHVAGGIFFATDASVRNPERFGARLTEYFLELGGKIVRKRVDAILPAELQTWRVAPADGTFTHVVVTAGAWSASLLRPLGYYVPLDTERGYNITLPEPNIPIRNTLLFPEAHIAVTPLDYGLRITGTVEFAGLQAAPNWNRSEMLVGLAKKYFPGVNCEKSTRWMGFRPALPDALPAMGKAARHDGLFYSFGHEHLGLTQAAISAECLATLFTGERSPLDLTPFDLERFRRS